MEFKQAHEKLKKLAKGKYFSLDYELTTYINGKKRTVCRVYIDGETYFGGATFAEAFRARKQAINPTVEQMPEGDI